MTKLSKIKILFLVLFLAILLSIVLESRAETKTQPSNYTEISQSIEENFDQINEKPKKSELVQYLSENKAQEDLLFVSTLEGNIHAYSAMNNKELWKISLGKPLIFSNINSKNILYDRNAVIPGSDGNIYYYTRNDEAEDEENYLRKIDVPLKTLVENSPFTFPNLPEYLFIGDKKSSLYTIDVDKGAVLSRQADGQEDYRRRPIQTYNLLTVIRTDYTLQCLHQLTGRQIWNVTVSEVMAIQKGSKTELALTNKPSPELQEIINNNPSFNSAVAIHQYGQDHTPVKVYDYLKSPQDDFMEFIYDQRGQPKERDNLFNNYIEWIKNRNSKTKRSLLNFLIFKFWEMYYFEDFFFIYISLIFILSLLVIYLLCIIYKFMKKNDILIKKVKEFRKLSEDADSKSDTSGNLSNTKYNLLDQQKEKREIEKNPDNIQMDFHKIHSEPILNNQIDEEHPHQISNIPQNINENKSHSIKLLKNTMIKNQGLLIPYSISSNFLKKSDKYFLENFEVDNNICDPNNNSQLEQPEVIQLTSEDFLDNSHKNQYKFSNSFNTNTQGQTSLVAIDGKCINDVASPQENAVDLLKKLQIDLGLKEHKKEVVTGTDYEVYKRDGEYVEKQVFTVITTYQDDEKVEEKVRQLQDKVNERAEQIYNLTNRRTYSFDADRKIEEEHKTNVNGKDHISDQEDSPKVKLSAVFKQSGNIINLEHVTLGEKNKHYKSEDRKEETYLTKNAKNKNKSYFNNSLVENSQSITVYNPSNAKQNKKRKYNTKDYSMINHEKINKTYIDEGRLEKNFEEIETIGKGGFGLVFKARHKIDSSNYAIKVIELKVGLSQNLMEHKVIKEVKTMMKLNHKNVVRYSTCWFQLKVDYLASIISSQSLDCTQHSKTLDPNQTQTKNQNKTILKEISENEEPSDDRQPFNWDITEKKDVESVIFTQTDKEESKNEINDKAFSVSLEKIESGDEKSLETSKHRNSFEEEISLIKSKKEAQYTVFFFLQMEYCDGLPLNQYLESKWTSGGMDRKLIYSFFKQMVSAVNHIHKNNVIHRDLK
jgi:hypothetical protein